MLSELQQPRSKALPASSDPRHLPRVPSQGLVLIFASNPARADSRAWISQVADRQRVGEGPWWLSEDAAPAAGIQNEKPFASSAESECSFLLCKGHGAPWKNALFLRSLARSGSPCPAHGRGCQQQRRTRKPYLIKARRGVPLLSWLFPESPRESKCVPASSFWTRGRIWTSFKQLLWLTVAESINQIFHSPLSLTHTSRVG